MLLEICGYLECWVYTWGDFDWEADVSWEFDFESTWEDYIFYWASFQIRYFISEFWNSTFDDKFHKFEQS